MKKYILIALIAGMAMTAQSQSTGTKQSEKKEMKSPDERAIHRTKRMTEKYKLDAVQSDRLLRLNREQLAKKEAAQKENEADKAQRKARAEARKAAHTAYMNEMRSIMNAEQFAAFEKDLETNKAKRKEARKSKIEEGN